jgi:hypothetical protein
MPRLVCAAAALIAIVASAGCDLLNRDRNPASPSPSVNLQEFAGTWTSGNAWAPATGCGNIQYTVTPVSATSATVTYSATCAGSIQVNGSGEGILKGATLEWSAQGLVAQGGVNCPFTFPGGKAALDGQNIKVTYSGTVCGIPVSGTEIVKRPTS